MMQGERILSEGNQAPLPHQAQLMGQHAAVDTEKRRHFLSGKGNGKGPGILLVCLHGQIGQNPIPQALLGENGQTVFLLHILVGDEGQHAGKHMKPKGFAHKTGMGEQGNRQIKHLCGPCSHGVIGGDPAAGPDQIGTGDFSGGDGAHQAFAAVCSDVQDVNLPGEDNAEPIHLLLRHNEELSLPIGLDMAVGQKLLADGFRREAGKQVGCEKKGESCVHGKNLL